MSALFFHVKKMQSYPCYIENPCCYLLTHCNQLWFWFVSQLPWHSVPVHLPGAAPCLLWREADRSRWQSNLPVSGISARILPLHWNYGHPGIQVINILTHKWQFYSQDENLIQCITIIATVFLYLVYIKQLNRWMIKTVW